MPQQPQTSDDPKIHYIGQMLCGFLSNNLGPALGQQVAQGLASNLAPALTEVLASPVRVKDSDGEVINTTIPQLLYDLNQNLCDSIDANEELIEVIRERMEEVKKRRKRGTGKREK